MPHHGEGVGVGGVVHSVRMINGVFTALTGGGVAAINGKVSLEPLQLFFPATLEALGAHIRASAPGQNMRMGLYHDNGDTPVGGALIVESASVATGAGRGKYEVAIANTTLPAGLYWMAIQSDGIDTFVTIQADESKGGTLEARSYNLAYGAFTDPCPATLWSDTPAMYAIVASVP